MQNEPFDLRINEPLPELDDSALDRDGPPLRGTEEHDAGLPNDDRPAEAAKKFTTLIEMHEDFEFFTPALINVAGRFDRDAVLEYNRLCPERDPAARPLSIDYAEALFSGLGLGKLPTEKKLVNWDNRLYAIVRDRWDQCRDMIGGIAIKNPATGSVSRVNFYELEIVDPSALKGMTVVDELPRVPITVFGIASLARFTYLQPAEYPRLPFVTSRPPRDNEQVPGVRSAESLFSAILGGAG